MFDFNYRIFDMIFIKATYLLILYGTLNWLSKGHAGVRVNEMFLQQYLFYNIVVAGCFDFHENNNFGQNLAFPH